MLFRESIGRRDFLAAFGVVGLVVGATGCRDTILAQKGVRTQESTLLEALRRNAITDTGVNWCGARDVPDSVSSHAKLAAADESGDRIVISGTVYETDGKTPAPNTLIYLYHTDVYGIYGRAGQHPHGKYRAWLLTDANGRYEFESIKPASYPDTTIAAHVHMTLTTVSRKEDWVDSILFEGDRFITASERSVRKGGVSGIVKLGATADGKLFANRDIWLG